MRKACGVEVLLFEIAHCLWICSFFCSNFEKKNRKGSPTSLIYPYIGKLTFFMIKQFFAFSREHQTLMRSRLRRFLPLSAALHQPKKNSLPVFHVGGIPLSMHHTQCADFDCKNFDSPFGLPQDDMQTRPRTTDLPAGLVCSEMTVGVGFGLYTVFFRRHS